MLRVLLFRNKSSNVLKLVRPRLEQKSEVVEMTEAAQGREDRNIFTHEYVSPQKQPSWSVWKKLNRQDCLRRRKQIEIPEFYVGSVIAVTYSDRFAADKSMRFVGRVICLEGFGTNHKMVLRNKIMESMVSIKIDVYSPFIQKIEVLRLEKWRDSNLTYLKHCDDFYCTFPTDMMAEPPPPINEQLPYFDGKVLFKKAIREVVPPVSEEDIRKDPISTIGKPRRGNYQRMIRGFNNRKAKNLGSSWPPIRNLFWEEYLIEEEKTHQSFIERSANWHRYDILRHHNFSGSKYSIKKEMMQNVEKIAATTKAIGRPKVDYSKISQICISSYNIET